MTLNEIGKVFFLKILSQLHNYPPKSYHNMYVGNTLKLKILKT